VEKTDLQLTRLLTGEENLSNTLFEYGTTDGLDLTIDWTQRFGSDQDIPRLLYTAPNLCYHTIWLWNSWRLRSHNRLHSTAKIWQDIPHSCTALRPTLLPDYFENGAAYGLDLTTDWARRLRSTKTALSPVLPPTICYRVFLSCAWSPLFYHTISRGNSWQLRSHNRLGSTVEIYQGSPGSSTLAPTLLPSFSLPEALNKASLSLPFEMFVCCVCELSQAVEKFRATNLRCSSELRRSRCVLLSSLLMISLILMFFGYEWGTWRWIYIYIYREREREHSHFDDWSRSGFCSLGRCLTGFVFFHFHPVARTRRSSHNSEFLLWCIVVAEFCFNFLLNRDLLDDSLGDTEPNWGSAVNYWNGFAQFFSCLLLNWSSQEWRSNYRRKLW
jgi:hypothetical protein